MAIARSVQGGQIGSHHLHSQSIPKPDQSLSKVSTLVIGIFQKIEHVLFKVWVVSVTVISKSWDAVTFLFFRVLDLVHPSLSPRVEGIYLRVSGLYERFRNHWAESSLQELNQDLSSQLEGVRAEVNQLSRNCRQLEGEKEDILVSREFIIGERDRLSENCARLEREKGDVVRDNQNLTQTIAEKDREIAAVRTQNEAIIIQRDALQAQVNQLLGKRGAALNNNTIDLIRGHLSPEDNGALNRLLGGVSLVNQFPNRG